MSTPRPSLGLGTKGQHADWFSQASLIHGHVLWSSGASKTNKVERFGRTLSSWLPREYPPPPNHVNDQASGMVSRYYAKSLWVSLRQKQRRGQREMREFETISIWCRPMEHLASQYRQHSTGKDSGTGPLYQAPSLMNLCLLCPHQPGGRIDAQKYAGSGPMPPIRSRRGGSRSRGRR